MQIADSRTIMDITYDLSKRVGVHDFEYIYRGNFSHNLIKRIVTLAEQNVQKLSKRLALQNKVYFIMVEGLQNITRHQDIVGNDMNMDDYSGIFSIQKLNNRYLITTGNLIDNSKVDSLKEKLTKVNGLEQDELKQLHKDLLITNKLSEKGGAGLGLIEMARRSGNKLQYKFETVDNTWSFFYLQTEISTNEPDCDKEEDGQVRQSVEEMQKLNHVFARENILLSFSGYFNQTNVLKLLEIIRGQMKNSLAAKKVYYIMVEMLQNISKHGDNIEESENGASGIFSLSRSTERYGLVSGNIIRNDKVDELRNKLESINSLDDNGLNDYFNDILLGKQNVNSLKTGLGFVDIRLKTNQKVLYKFRKVNDNFSFFTIEIYIKNQ